MGGVAPTSTSGLGQAHLHLRLREFIPSTDPEYSGQIADKKGRAQLVITPAATAFSHFIFTFNFKVVECICRASIALAILF